jgi:hypothetical protein
MANAKQEFLELDELEGKDLASEFMGAQLKYRPSWEDKEWIIFDSSQYEEFLKWLDFEYDDGYGSQELHGFILLKGNSWLDRHEYDGSEHWVLRERPVLNHNINKKK